MRKTLALLAFLLAALLTVPATAAEPAPAIQRVTTAQGNTVSFYPDGNAHVELAAGWVSSAAVVCNTDGRYGNAIDSATNGNGQSLEWWLAVDFDAPPDCVNTRVRYWMRLSTNTAANFANQQAELLYKNCLPDQSCAINSYGRRDFATVNNAFSATFVGGWHTDFVQRSVKSRSNDFWVRFLSTNTLSQHRKRCSHWVHLTVFPGQVFEGNC